MIKALGWYSWHQVTPRLLSIFHWSSALWPAVAIGTALGYWGGHFVPATTTVGTVVVEFLTYAAIALGFSLAGLTLVLTLPSVELVNWLCGTQPPNKKYDSYSDLLLVFSWTAVIHWAIVFGSIVLVLLVNPSQPAFEIGRHQFKSAAAASLGVYGLLEFFVTLITLAQLGFTYSLHLRKPRKQVHQAVPLESKGDPSTLIP